jgi:hypothetical protein
VHTTSSTDQPSPAATRLPTVRPGAPLAAWRANARSKSTAIFPKTNARLLGNVLKTSGGGHQARNPCPPKTDEDVMNSTMSTETTTPARILAEGYGPGAWHGPDFKAALTGLSPRGAFWRPAPGRHNIAEIALHHAWYVRSVIQRLTGKEPEPFVLEGEDWFAVSDGGRLGWPDIAAVVEQQQGRLVAVIGDLGAGRIRSPLSEPERFDLVLGITCHAIYHAGQVQLLKVLGAA